MARDIVSVDMEGPHCQNLTLIDLPGIVRTTGKGETQSLAEDISSLMLDYLKNPRCVILAVLPCNVDFHNSQIMAEARKVDPETKRTIPVLTKPDLIDVGAESSVLELLLGQKTDTFEMGFHMIKGRGQEALTKKLSIEKGLAEEESFFRNSEPWRSTDNRSLFGTKQLRFKLAGLQMELIRSSFRKIVQEMKERRDEAVMKVKELGEIPSDLIGKRSLFLSIKEEMWKGISNYTLDGHICSLHIGAEMRPSAKFHAESKRFQGSLNSSKLANISDITVGTNVIAIVDGKEVLDEVCFVNASKVFIKMKSIMTVGVNDANVNQLKSGKPDNIIEQCGRVFIEREDGTVDELKYIDRKLVRSDPHWISQFIEQNRPYKLPIFINTHVFEAIVAHLIDEEWAQPSRELLEFTSQLMDAAAESFIEKLRAIKSIPLLAAYLCGKATEVVENLKQDVAVKVNEFICREKVPYTQNHYLFENVSKLRSQRLMDEVLAAISGTCGEGASQVVVVPSSIHSNIKNVFQRNQKKSVDDHMAEEMEHALNSYGKVALKRFVDNVPMICVEIMQRFSDKMNGALSEITDEEIERVVAAPPDKILCMNKLKREVDTLNKGIATIRGLF